MKRIRKVLSLLLAFILVFSIGIDVNAINIKESSLDVSINGKRISDSSAVKKVDNLVFVGMRAVATGAKIAVSWDSKKNVMTVKNGKKIIKVTANSSKITVNGSTFNINAKPRLINSRLFVPTGFFTKNTGFSVRVSNKNVAVKVIAASYIKPTEKPAATVVLTPAPIVKPTAAITATPTPTLTLAPTPIPTPTLVLNNITEVTNGTEAGIFYIQIKGDKAIKLSNYSVTKPLNLVFDVSSSKLVATSRKVSIYNDFCNTARHYMATDKKNTVRIRLELKKKSKFQVVTSDEGKTARIYFKSDLTSITNTIVNSDDILRFSGVPYADWKIVYDKANNKIVLTANRVLKPVEIPDFATKYAEKISVFAPSDGNIKVEINLLDGVFYVPKSVSDEMQLTLTDSPTNFMTYFQYGTTATAQVSYGKNYTPVCILDRANGTYTVSAPGNFGKLVSTTSKNDNLVEKYNISLETRGTEKFTVATFKILPTTSAEILSNKDGTVKIRFMKVAISSSQMTIVIDAGHGGADSGAVGYLNGAVIKEKAVNLDVALRLDRILRENGFKTLLTRKTDVAVDLNSRGPMANKINADFFVSIHHNSAVSSAANGLSTLYKQYAESDLKPVTNKTIATLFQNNMLRDLKRRDIGISLRPELCVLRTTEMPSLLMELGFLCNKAELAQIIKYQYREMAARSLAVSIIDYFNKYQGSSIDIDTNTILNRKMSTDKWQKYLTVVPPVSPDDQEPTPIIVPEIPVVPVITPETTAVPASATN